jgi:hypothetical protein
MTMILRISTGILRWQRRYRQGTGWAPASAGRGAVATKDFIAVFFSTTRNCGKSSFLANAPVTPGKTAAYWRKDLR